MPSSRTCAVSGAGLAPARARACCVTGPPGIGKTRLVQELADEVRRDGGAVAYGELEEAHGPTLLVLEDVAQAPEVPPDRPVLAVATAVEGEGETLPLAPLERDDVAALARYHAGARASVEPPVDRLLAESGGVPARVHRAAAAWARAVATRRVGEAAARASAERAGWHLAGDDVATEVVELQTVRERAQLAGSGALPACPFKGLASFDVDDAPVFFGRERLVADMIAGLTGTRLMGIVGPSGSGKSSALRAGLLAALADGVLPGSERWPQALIRPGAHPLAALERATAELPASERWIVAVDQFEEAFTACRDAAERAAFVDALVACARDPGRRTLVLVAVRADFYGHCARYSELSRLLGANQVLVGPMRRHELRRAIELPARRAGLRVETELVDALLDDVEDEPGALPLLSTALLELWQQRDGRRLTMGAYERTGGVLGAVARLAERAYERLDVPQREAARRLLLRLAGDGGVRVRVPIGDLPGDVHDVLSVLASDRLITVGDGEVEVAHEALLREWPRLRAWLDEDADGRRVHRHLTEAARGWDAGGRDAGELYRGSRLVAASEWATAHDEDLNRLEREFLAAARAASEAEAERRRRANRRLRALLAGVGTLLVLAVAAGAIAVSQRGQARDAALVADAQRLGAEALTNERIDQALLLARAGVELDDTTATRSNLLALLVRDPAVARRAARRRLAPVLAGAQRRRPARRDRRRARRGDRLRHRHPHAPQQAVHGGRQAGPGPRLLPRRPHARARRSLLHRRLRRRRPREDLRRPDRPAHRRAPPVHPAAAAPEPSRLGVRAGSLPAQRPRPDRAADRRRLPRRPRLANLAPRRGPRHGRGPAARARKPRGLEPRHDRRPQAGIRHQSGRRRHLGDRPDDAARGAHAPGGRPRGRGQRGRPPVRARLPGRHRAPARPQDRRGPPVPRPAGERRACT